MSLRFARTTEWHQDRDDGKTRPKDAMLIPAILPPADNKGLLPKPERKIADRG